MQEFDALGTEVLERSRGRSVLFMVVDGNLGDGLIRLGTERFLENYGVPHRTFILNSRPNRVRALARSATPNGSAGRPLVLFNGGGGWAEHCSTAERGVELQRWVNRDVLVLPSTVERTRLRPMPRIYRRDNGVSAMHLPEAPFCHDMAFFLATVPLRTWYRRATSTSNHKVGIFFRTDNESRYPYLRQVPGNVDVSAKGTSGADVTGFLDAIAACEEVLTDRLHVAIGGALLGKTVHLVEGASPKIRSIYDSSLRPYFPNCSLVSHQQALEIAGH